MESCIVFFRRFHARGFYDTVRAARKTSHASSCRPVHSLRTETVVIALQFDVTLKCSERTDRRNSGTHVLVYCQILPTDFLRWVSCDT